MKKITEHTDFKFFRKFKIKERNEIYLDLLKTKRYNELRYKNSEFAEEDLNIYFSWYKMSLFISFLPLLISFYIFPFLFLSISLILLLITLFFKYILNKKTKGYKLSKDFLTDEMLDFLNNENDNLKN